MTVGGGMSSFLLSAPCHFGLEAVLKREISDLGYGIVKVEDGRVTYTGDEAAISRSNMFLRTAERVLVNVGEIAASDFDTLYNETRKIDWQDLLPADAKVWVKKASSIKSRLTATVTIQSVMKKAIADKLCSAYGLNSLPETGAEYPIRVFLNKDVMSVGIDSSGESLHKRGYRQLTTKAPIEETLASALIMLTPYHHDRVLADPFCGSGTFAIEAALMALDIAPGIGREFTAEKWKNICGRKYWYQAVNEATEREKRDRKLRIYASDIDKEVLSIAKKNAQLAGVDDKISFKCAPAQEFAPAGDYGFVITNPPYGARLEDIPKAEAIWAGFCERMKRLPTWSCYVISPLERTEELMGRKADRKRKVYNGMLKTDFYQFSGSRPVTKG